jgi:hypothetical protein
MRFRKLRIAWSVACGIACVLLFMLSRRSFTHWDILSVQNGLTRYEIISVAGGLEYTTSEVLHPTKWSFESAIADTEPSILGAKYSFWAFKYAPPEPTSLNTLAAEYFVPSWFVILVTAILSGASWLPWSKRFTLRTLLIATTLVAVVLGLIVYAVR